MFKAEMFDPFCEVLKTCAILVVSDHESSFKARMDGSFERWQDRLPHGKSLCAPQCRFGFSFIEFTERGDHTGGYAATMVIEALTFALEKGDLVACALQQKGLD